MLPSQNRTFQYIVGNEHNPANPSGRFDLRIVAVEDAVSVELWHYVLDQVHGWTATLDGQTEQQIWASLAMSDFPNTAGPASILPDTTLADLTVENYAVAPGKTGVVLPLDLLKQQPGYKETIAILDAIVYQICNGSITGVTSELTSTVVSDIRNNHTETAP